MGKARKSQEMGSAGLSGAAVSSDALAKEIVMGKRPQRVKGQATPSASGSGSAEKPEPFAHAIPKSNLIDELIKARKTERHSVRSLSEAAGVTPSAIRKLEDGQGSISTLLAVLDALPFQVAGLARGRTFSEQLRNRRVKRTMPLDTLATKTSLSPQDIIQLEEGEGSVEDLLRLLAVIAPQISRHKPERAYWKLGDKADRDSRFTPDAFMQPIYRAFGKIALDPCAHPLSPVVARRYFLFDKGDDGLTKPWSGPTVFMNPPFSQQMLWLQRAHHEWKAGNVETVICLVPVRTDSGFFHDIIAVEADLYLLRGRVPFSNPAGTSQVTPFSLMIVAFGATADQKTRFEALVPGFWVPSHRKLGIAMRETARIVAARARQKRGGSRSIVFSFETSCDSCKSRASRGLGVSCS